MSLLLLLDLCINTAANMNATMTALKSPAQDAFSYLLQMAWRGKIRDTQLVRSLLSCLEARVASGAAEWSFFAAHVTAIIAQSTLVVWHKHVLKQQNWRGSVILVSCSLTCSGRSACMRDIIHMRLGVPPETGCWRPFCKSYCDLSKTPSIPLKGVCHCSANLMHFEGSKQRTEWPFLILHISPEPD